MRCSIRNATPDAGAVAVAFQVQLALEGLVDRLDELPQRLEQLRARPLGFALTNRPQPPHAELANSLLELPAVVVLVGDQDLPRLGRDQLRLDRQQLEQHLAFISLGASKRDGHRRPCRVQTRCSHSPRSSTNGCGVHHPDVVAPQRRVAGHDPNEMAQQLDRAAQPR
jgi:hypothetical protein